VQQDRWSAVELNKRRKRLEVLCQRHDQWNHTPLFPEKAISEIAPTGMQNKRVYVRLPSDLFRAVHCTLPANAESPEAYIEKMVRDNLPPGLPRANCRIGYRLYWGEQVSSALIWIARNDVVLRWLQAFEAGEIWLAGITGAFDDALTALATMEPDFYQKRYAVILPDAAAGANGFVYMFCDCGVLKDYRRFSNLQAFRDMVQPAPDCIVLSQETNADLCDALFGIAPLVSVSGFKKEDSKTPLPLELMGLALQAFMPGLEMDYAEDDDLHTQNVEHNQTVRSIHFGLIAASVIFVLWMMLFGAQLYVAHELDAVSAGKQHLEQRIEQIENLKKLRSNLEAEFEIRRDIINQRSQAAQMLDKIASSLLEETWLRRIVFGQSGAQKEVDPEEAGQIIIEGLALEESGATELLAAIEKRPEFTEPQLELIRLLPADLVLKKTKTRRIPVVEFRLKTTWKSHAR
jgi:Tfp pilus assembly protein PilN